MNNQLRTLFGRHKMAMPRRSSPRKSSVTRWSVETQFEEQHLWEYVNSLKRLLRLRQDENSSPVIWERLANGYRILDLQMDRYEEAMLFIQEQFMQKEPICTAVGLAHDALSVAAYLYVIITKIAETHSSCAVEEGTNRLVGVIVTSMVPMEDYLDVETCRGPVDCSIMNEIATVKGRIFRRANLNERLDIDKYLSICVVSVAQSEQGKGIGTALLRSAVTRAKELLVPACIGLFSSGASQTIGKYKWFHVILYPERHYIPQNVNLASRLGFETYAEIPYAECVLNCENPFAQLGGENYSCACMVLPIDLTVRMEQIPAINSAPSTISKQSKQNLKNM